MAGITVFMRKKRVKEIRYGAWGLVVDDGNPHFFH